MIATEADYFLESDASIETRTMRENKRNYDKGSALKLKTKALCMKLHLGKLYVGESGFYAKRYGLDCWEKRKENENVSAEDSSKEGLVGEVLYGGHCGPVCAIDVGFKVVVTASWDKNIHLYNESVRK